MAGSENRGGVPGTISHFNRHPVGRKKEAIGTEKTICKEFPGGS